MTNPWDPGTVNRKVQATRGAVLVRSLRENFFLKVRRGGVGDGVSPRAAEPGPGIRTCSSSYLGVTMQLELVTRRVGEESLPRSMGFLVYSIGGWRIKVSLIIILITALCIL